MAPIKIGFIGLSASGSWASNAHLPYLQNTDKYTITALCNSSVEAAQAAKKEYKLADSVKTYGDPQDIANDPDVDLVVCSVRVDRHFDTLVPSLESGKDAFVEWPLAHNLQAAENLLELAKKNGCKVMVGLQARLSPFMNKVKEVIAAGKIGKVLSSTLTLAAFNFGATLPSTVEYLIDSKIGGNMLTIHFAHPTDAVLQTLGELETMHALLSTQRGTMDVIDKKSGETTGVIHPDTPDQIMLQGKLESGAVLSVHMRGGPPFKGEPGFVWRIYGDAGELYATADSAFVNMGSENMEIRFHDHAKDSVETISWRNDTDEFEKLPMTARNVARLYEAFASGESGTYADWDDAVVRHRLLDNMQRSYRS